MPSASAAMSKPATPSAQRAARAIDFGPIAAASTGGPPGCTGARPDRRRRLDGALAVPDPPHRRDLFVERRVPARERRAHRAVVLVAPADADAEHEPTVREHVDRRGLLRDVDRGVHRRDAHRRFDAHPFGDGRRAREQRHHLLVRVRDPFARGEHRERARRRRRASTRAASSRVSPATIDGNASADLHAHSPRTQRLLVDEQLAERRVLRRARAPSGGRARARR